MLSFSVLPPHHLQRAMRECFVPDPALAGSNIISSSEAVLLRWLAYHNHRVNGPPADGPSPGGRRLVNFDSDLADGTVFLSVLIAHVPDLVLPGHALDPDTAAAAGTPFHLPYFVPAHLRKAGVVSTTPPGMAPAPLTRRQCADNARALLAALRELQLEPPFDIADLTAMQGSAIEAAATAAAPAPGDASAPPAAAAKPPASTNQRGGAAAAAGPSFISPVAAAELLNAGSPPPPASAPFDVPGGAPASSAPVPPGSATGPVATAAGAVWERVGGGALRCGGVLVALWFFTALPQLVPRACLDLRGPLAQTTTRNVTLVNPSKKVRGRAMMGL